MLRIETLEEAEPILQLSIESRTRSREIAEEFSTIWELVGEVQPRKGEPTYVFDAISKLTMYSEAYNIRRWPTPYEVDQAKEMNNL